MEATVTVILELVVMPAASRGFAKVTERIRNRRRGPADAGAGLAPSSSTDVGVAAEDELVENAPVEMGAAEYRERLLRMLIAESIAASEREFLADAIVTDDGLDRRLRPALDLVLEGNWTALGEAELDLVRSFFEGARTADGQYELLRIERPQLPPSP